MSTCFQFSQYIPKIETADSILLHFCSIFKKLQKCFPRWLGCGRFRLPGTDTSMSSPAGPAGQSSYPLCQAWARQVRFSKGPDLPFLPSPKSLLFQGDRITREGRGALRAWPALRWNPCSRSNPSGKPCGPNGPSFRGGSRGVRISPWDGKVTSQE